jgi:hypothetical protein
MTTARRKETPTLGDAGQTRARDYKALNLVDQITQVPSSGDKSLSGERKRRLFRLRSIKVDAENAAETHGEARSQSHQRQIVLRKIGAGKGIRTFEPDPKARKVRMAPQG